MERNYLGIGHCLGFLLNAAYLQSFEDVESVFRSGDLAEMLDTEPESPTEMWKALHVGKYGVDRKLVATFPLETGKNER